MTTTLLDQLSPRELEVLALMAEGRSNRAIGEELTVELKTVETHVGRVFAKLGLSEDRQENRRVLAVRAFFGREDHQCCGVSGPPAGSGWIRRVVFRAATMGRAQSSIRAAPCRFNASSPARMACSFSGG
jgi:DNA-binding CsgD family transcriptional regulator